MTKMKNFIAAKTIHLAEDSFKVKDESNNDMVIAASPIKSSEIKNMIKQGVGLRILVGADNMKTLLVVWAGDGNSDVGAMHDTVAGHFGMNMHNERHIPLELTKQGQMRVTITAQAQYDDPRAIEDVLDRNREFKKLFGNYPIDYSALEESETYQPPEIEVGDEVRVGKFKNRKAEVTGFKKDKHNHPVLKTTKGDQQLFKPRLTKILPQ